MCDCQVLLKLLVEGVSCEVALLLFELAQLVKSLHLSR